MEATATKIKEDPLRATRVDLALCYRLVAHYGMADQIYTHISARVPGTADRFLLSRLGVAFDEMTASDLVEVGLDGPPDQRADQALYQAKRERRNRVIAEIVEKPHLGFTG